MRLSKTAYYADFIVYAAIVVVLAIHVLAARAVVWRLRWLRGFALGMGAWTLLEYLLHR